MSKGSSYRQILRSSSIIGGASVINILVGLLRTKVVAVLLGPTGVGLIGLFQNLMGAASTAASLGFGNAGTRQIAEATVRDDAHAVAAARRALFWGTLVLAVVGAGIFWQLRGVLAERVMGDVHFTDTIGWLSPGVALAIASGSQGALLNGMRRIGDMARVSVWSALLSTVLGIGALWLWGWGGVLAFVLSAPLASFLLGHLYVARLPRVQASPASLSMLMKEWRLLVTLGAAFMVAGLAGTLGQLLVRTLVQRDLGTEALGHFQAAWAISMTYIGFVLTAMGTDYYPRLTAAIRDHAAVNRMVNEQTEVVLLLAGPVFVAMIGLAPWVIDLLYSSRFAEAAAILRWQVLGDIVKVASWPLGFIILAAGDGRTFMLTESFTVLVFAGLTWLGIPLFGIQATGMAFLGMYLVLLPLVHWLARRRTAFTWTRTVFRHGIVLVFVATCVFVVAAWSIIPGAIVGVLAAILLAIRSLGRLGHVTNLGGPLGRLAALSRRASIKAGLWHD